ncbi:MAG: hypothetical protein K2X82_32170 [Gemmataceae bacterium]|nr:hypothetical protein [Gemmataceae bacterium]
MPSRPVVVLIVLFWAGTVGLVFYRDLWPRLAASGPPPIAVDLGDEASQREVLWAVLHNGQKAGRLASRTQYVDADDTFEFGYKYTKVVFDVPGGRVLFPEVAVTTRVSRDGALRAQSMAGRMEILLARPNQDGVTDTIPLGDAEAKVEGRVEGGAFVGRCDLTGRFGGKSFSVHQDLDPVPVPDGQALGPLQPVNRLATVRPGQRWVVREVDPLVAAVAAVAAAQAREHGVPLPGEKPEREPLVATVAADPEPPPGRPDPCRVIEYREGDEVRAKTWVRVADGKVLRQEAFLAGESVALVREE